MTPLPQNQKTVLIVEDDDALRNLYRQSLVFEGYKVLVADDGVAALRQLEQQRPDVIVLDLALPRLSGWQLHRELSIRPELRDVPVIVVTGSDPSVLATQVAALLIKPVRILDVVEEVRRVTRVA